MKKHIIIGIAAGVALLAAMIGIITFVGKKKADSGAAATVQAGEEKGVEGDISPLDYDEDMEMDREYSTEYGSILTGSEWGNNWEGSATFLKNTNVIVTIAVDTMDQPFVKSDLEAMRQRGQAAVDFIVDQGKQYGADVKLIYNKDDINFSYQYDGDDISGFEFEDYDYIMEQLCRNTIDTEKIRKNYKAEGIAFLFLLNGTGDNFASTHLMEDDTAYFYEGAFVFLRGYDYYGDEIECGPAAYAHQLLRLFGAVELEIPDASNGYTTALCNVVHEKYLDDIMYTSLDKTGQMALDRIDKVISPITAYAVDFTESFEELSANPSFTKTYIASFTDMYMENTKDNSDTSAYEWNPDWDEDEYYSELVEESFDDDDYWDDDDESWDDSDDDLEEDENWDEEDWEDETLDEDEDYSEDDIEDID